jgi:hypothetical protein
MIEKIISSGLAGAPATALDVAIKLGLAYGGYRPEGESVAKKYQLERMPAASYRQIAEKSVVAGQGSLYFHEGRRVSLQLETLKKIVQRLNKPLLTLDLARESGFTASRRIAVWIVENAISVLHVDGESGDQISPATADRIAKILEATFFLTMMEADGITPMQSVREQVRQPQVQLPPQTVDAALTHLERDLSLKDRATIANMAAGELIALQATLGSYINSHFDLFTTNTELLSDCRRRSGRWDLAPKDAATVIIQALWDRLRATCRIRIVK